MAGRLPHWTGGPFSSTERPSGDAWTVLLDKPPVQLDGKAVKSIHPTPNLYSYPSLCLPTLRRRPVGGHQPSIKHLDGQVDGSSDHAIDLDYDELT